MGGARVIPRASAGCSVFEESGRASLTLRLGNDSYIDVLARRACDVLDSSAGIGLGAAARRNRFEESIGTTLAHRLSGDRSGYAGVLARRALGMCSATTIGTTYIYDIESRMMVVACTTFNITCKILSDCPSKLPFNQKTKPTHLIQKDIPRNKDPI